MDFPQLGMVRRLRRGACFGATLVGVYKNKRKPILVPNIEANPSKSKGPARKVRPTLMKLLGTRHKLVCLVLRVPPFWWLLQGNPKGNHQFKSRKRHTKIPSAMDSKTTSSIQLSVDLTDQKGGSSHVLNATSSCMQSAFGCICKPHLHPSKWGWVILPWLWNTPDAKGISSKQNWRKHAGGALQKIVRELLHPFLAFSGTQLRSGCAFLLDVPLFFPCEVMFIQGWLHKSHIQTVFWRCEPFLFVPPPQELLCWTPARTKRG